MRIVCVNPADPGDASLEQLTEQWWSTAATMSAVTAGAAEHRTGPVELTVLVRTRHPEREIVVDRVRWCSVRDDTRSGWRVARRVRALRPDVVHANGFVFPLRTLSLRLANPRVPILLQHHGEPPARRTSTARAQRLVGRFVDGVAFTGAHHGAAEPWLVARVLAPDTPLFEVIESVVRLPRVDRVEARSATAITGSPVLLWVGRAEPVKDPLGAVAAFELAAGRLPGAELWMVSSGGSLADSLAAAVAASPVGKRIHVVGPFPRGELAAWYSAADVFVSSSRHEGSGYALLEAIACGCPQVAATDLPSHRAITGTTSGAVPGDAASLAAAITDATSRLRSGGPPTTPPDPAGQLLDAYADVRRRR